MAESGPALADLMHWLRAGRAFRQAARLLEDPGLTEDQRAELRDAVANTARAFEDFRARLGEHCLRMPGDRRDAHPSGDGP